MRVLLAEIFFLLGFFWFAGIIQTVFYVASFVMLATAVVGFCGVYAIFGIQTCTVSEKPTSKTALLILSILFVITAVGGAYASNFFTKKFFLEDYSSMNQYYKQALFFTGQEKREEAVSNYQKLMLEYGLFQAKYQRYHPYIVAQDKAFNSDLDRIAVLIANPKEKILTGDLKSAHLDLEQVRPVFQDILKRNGFSMLAVYLVDFHDAMEKIITAADNKSPESVISTYPEVSDKLKMVEETANDAEIQSIRQNLDQLLSLANANNTAALSAKAAELKSSFVKVYLKRG